MSKSLVAAALCAACLTAPTAASSQEFQVPVSGSFSEYPLEFTGGIPDPYVAMWDVIEYQGQMALCGIGYLRDSRFASTVRGMARDAGLFVDGQIRPVDMTFFTRARSARSIRTGTATCRVVGPLPRTNGGIGILFASGTLRN